MHHIAQENHAPQETCVDPSRRPRSRRAALVTAGILAVGVAVPACGGNPATAGVATGSTPTAAGPSAGSSMQATGLLAYAYCMRSHGVPNFPNPPASGGIPKKALPEAEHEVGSSQLNAALDDCRHLLPAGFSTGGQYVVTPADEADYLKSAVCMRSHGVPNFPDPNFSGGTVSFRIPASIDTNSTQFTQAQQTCQKLIPAGLPYSGSGG
jgi:hypothetical protein